MKEFLGFLILCAGLVLLPVPATMLFGVSYGTALGAALLGVGAAFLVQLGVGLMVK